MNRQEAERAILEVLAALPTPAHTLHRLEIGAEVWAKTGGTMCASVIGSLLERGWISRPTPDPGPRCHRYKITALGRLQLEAADVFGGAA